MFADATTQEYGSWAIVAVGGVLGFGGLLRLLLDYRTLTTPKTVPVAHQFTTHGEVAAVELRLAQKVDASEVRLTHRLDTQDNNIVSLETRTVSRFHEMAGKLQATDNKVAALPLALHKDIEALLKPLTDQVNKSVSALVKVETQLEMLVRTKGAHGDAGDA